MPVFAVSFLLAKHEPQGLANRHGLAVRHGLQQRTLPLREPHLEKDPPPTHTAARSAIGHGRRQRAPGAGIKIAFPRLTKRGPVWPQFGPVLVRFLHRASHGAKPRPTRVCDAPEGASETHGRAQMLFVPTRAAMKVRKFAPPAVGGPRAHYRRRSATSRVPSSLGLTVQPPEGGPVPVARSLRLRYAGGGTDVCRRCGPPLNR